MQYLFIQCFWWINICVKAFTYSSIIDHNAQNSEIDDFIRQLLTSQKFDELADKIAEKAVDKIIQFEHGSQGSEIKLKSNLSAKNVSNTQDIQTRHRDKPVKQHEETKELQDDEKMPINKIGKINMQAFMKKDASSKSENLSLKYKYLTQKSNKKEIKSFKEKSHKQLHTGSMVLRNNDQSDKNSEKHSVPGDIIEPEEIDNGSEADVPVTSHENSRDKSLIAQRELEEDKLETYYDQNVMTNIYHKDGDEDHTNVNGTMENREADDEHYYDASMENHDNVPKNEIRFFDAKKNITLQTLTLENKTATESSENKGNDATVEQGDDGNSHEDSHENEVNSQNSPKAKSLNRVRTEGEKKFVFQSSAEYTDYLQEYDKVRNDHLEKGFL